MAHPSETPYVQPDAVATTGLGRKLLLATVAIVFLLVNVIVLYALHFTAAGQPLSASNVKVSSDAFKVGSIDNKVVSFAADGSLVVGAGTTAYLDAAALPSEDLGYLLFGPIGKNASSTVIVSYYLASKKSSVITTMTVNADKSTTFSKQTNTAEGVQVRGIATMSDTQAVFLESTSIGKVTLVPGTIDAGAVKVLADKAVPLAPGSISNQLNTISSTMFATTTFDAYNPNETYYQNIHAGSVAADGTISLAKPLRFGTGNNIIEGKTVTNSGPEPVPAIPNGFVVTWFSAGKNATSGLCVLLANATDAAVNQMAEKCNPAYQPAGFVDATTLSPTVLALSFYDAANNNALTLVIVEINTFKTTIHFRGTHVLSSVAGPFDFGSYYAYYPTPYVQAISASTVSIVFQNPNNQGRPSTQVFRVTDAFQFEPVSPIMRLSNGDFTIAGKEVNATGASVTLTVQPIAPNAYVTAYAGTLSGVNHKRISVVEFKGTPVGIGAGSDGLVMNGVVSAGGNYVAGKTYYATTNGDILAATDADTGADYVFVGKTTVVSKDSRVGVAVTSSKLYLSNSP